MVQCRTETANNTERDMHRKYKKNSFLLVMTNYNSFCKLRNECKLMNTNPQEFWKFIGNKKSLQT